MVEREAACADVLTQLSAATAAMKKTGVAIIQANMRRCMEEADRNPEMKLEDFQKGPGQIHRNVLRGSDRGIAEKT